MKPAVDGFVWLARAVGKGDVVESWASDDTSEIDDALSAVSAHYPMLSQFEHYYLRNEVDMLKKYVQMCDKAHAYDSLSAESKAA